MNLDGIELRHRSGLWLGAVATRFGPVEVLFDGSETGPDDKQVQAYRRFAEGLEDNISRLRNQMNYAFL